MATARALRLAVTRTPAATRGGLLPLPAARRRFLSASSTEAGGAGDPAVHSGDAPSDDYVDRPPRFSGAEDATAGDRGGKRPVGKAAAAEAEERVPPFAPSGKKPPLAGSSHHQELADPAASASFTQKRRVSSASASASATAAGDAARERDPREAATPGGAESAARKVREEDREYYRTRKPSPLAEVEFADTRKPITRATDGGGATDRDAQGLMVQDTADDSLARAEAIFRDAARRGNPEWPHSRALAQMLARRELGKKDAAAGSDKPCWGS